MLAERALEGGGATRERKHAPVPGKERREDARERVRSADREEDTGREVRRARNRRVDVTQDLRRTPAETLRHVHRRSLGRSALRARAVKRRHEDENPEARNEDALREDRAPLGREGSLMHDRGRGEEGENTMRGSEQTRRVTRRERRGERGFFRSRDHSDIMGPGISILTTQADRSLRAVRELPRRGHAVSSPSLPSSVSPRPPDNSHLSAPPHPREKHRGTVAGGG